MRTQHANRKFVIYAAANAHAALISGKLSATATACDPRASKTRVNALMAARTARRPDACRATPPFEIHCRIGVAVLGGTHEQFIRVHHVADPGAPALPIASAAEFVLRLNDSNIPISN